jgi:lauroyl/myristoyl acyltransferase
MQYHDLYVWRRRSTAERLAEGDSVMDLSLVSYYAYRLMGAVMPRIPPSLGYALFDRLGKLAYERSTTSRENVHDNLQHVLGPQADPARIEQVARQAFRHQSRNYYDLFRVASLSDDQIRGLVTPHGLEHVDQALSAGKGVIMVAVHFGNIDIVMQMFALLNYPMTAVAERLKPEKLYQYVASLRGSKGVTLIPIDSFLRPLFKALRNNEIVGLAGDRNLTGTGTVVDFFGAPCLLNDGPVSLALRTGAKLVPAFSLRNPANSFDAYVEPALALEKTGDSVQDVRAGMAKLAAVLEKWIGQYPEQWVMFQPIWRVPHGSNSL